MENNDYGINQIFWDRCSVGFCKNCGVGHHLVDGICYDCREHGEYQNLLHAYNLREQVLDMVQAEADRYLKDLIEAKRELKDRDQMLAELIEKFTEVTK